MSFWQRLRDRLGRPAREGEAGSADAAGPEAVPGAGERALPRSGRAPGVLDDVARLGRLGEADGPTVDEAIAMLRRARGTVAEADAVAAALKGAAERTLPEPVRIACADVLSARGEAGQALDLLAGVTSAPGLVLAADLLAALGHLARAVGTIERLLAREIDAPGARERHARWRTALGLGVAPQRRLDEATVVAVARTGAPFRLLREVARGGAGTVYEAEDALLGRRVAFKVYHGRGADRGMVEREARAAAALAGPGVVRVYDASPPDGWVALEWIARGSIRDLLRTGDFAQLTPVARWARPLARALARVHEAGMVHADVKPANVLMRSLSEPVLGDFGIARPRGERCEGGSAGYVSPERMGGRSGDPRDDVYAFGRVVEDVLHRLAEGGVDGADLGTWWELVERCLGGDERRPADGASLARAVP